MYSLPMYCYNVLVHVGVMLNELVLYLHLRYFVEILIQSDTEVSSIVIYLGIYCEQLK